MTELAIITGTSRGIGAGIAAAADAAGNIVAPCNRSATGADHELVVDLAEPASWAAFASWADDLVDLVAPTRLVFIHNAATLSPIGFCGEVDAATYQANVLMNSAAPQVLGDAIARTASRTGTATVIVQLSSGAAKKAYPGWTSYGAAKAAVDHWVRTLGAEQAERNDLIRAAAINPGVVATGMQALIRSSDIEAFPDVARFRGMHTDGVLGDPAAVGAELWHLAADGDWPNGALLAVDGSSR